MSDRGKNYGGVEQGEVQGIQSWGGVAPNLCTVVREDLDDLGRDQKKVIVWAVLINEGYVFQTEGTANAKVLGAEHGLNGNRGGQNGNRGNRRHFKDLSFYSKWDKKSLKYVQRNHDMIWMFSESFCLLCGQEPVGKGGRRSIRALQFLLAGNDGCQTR